MFVLYGNKVKVDFYPNDFICIITNLNMYSYRNFCFPAMKSENRNTDLTLNLFSLFVKSKVTLPVILFAMYFTDESHTKYYDISIST